ncbi:carbon-nitrogen hydrolase family protein [Pseudorhodoferax soli]|uniref:5-aminopentanamidase n=1 Tax=Pseudorhodoferax soli TaxID=545864 RepID=A0A368XQT4_9BURK|nr:carbon-nitrogen hydrolase family protein [Pseudorhodoferax soli]RCW70331.1 5-aminopentanamidase [Pseudorhodoferax soli]
MNELRLALLQCTSAPGDVARNLQRLDRACQHAAAAGTHLLVTPEMFLTGYNIGGAAAAALAEAPGGGRTAAVGALARRHGIAIVFGHPERDERGGIGNMAVCVDRDGRVVGRHQKTQLFGELDRSMFTAGGGDTLPFALHGWMVGMLVCYDVEFPENARRLALQHADLVVVPTANMEGYDFVAQHLVPTRAYENQLFVAYANFCGQEAGIAYNGLSCVAAPDGAVLAQADRQPSLLFARLQRSMLAAARERLGHLSQVRAQRLSPDAPH